LNKLLTPAAVAADLATASRESILEEAQRLTHGDRAKDYGHPLDDYTRTAALVSALLAHKLKEPITPGEMAMSMICVKLSRQVNHPKRDNMVDAAGYAWVSQECVDETARRNRIHSEGCPELKGTGACHCDKLKADFLGRTFQTMDAPLPQVLQAYFEQAPPAPHAPVGHLQVHYCLKSSHRVAPVIGCDCSRCTEVRSNAATGV